MARQRWKFPKSGGFTLIELLVVIGISALIAAIIVPARASTKPVVKGFQCLANTRRLMQANLMYQSDNRDYFPMMLHGAPDLSIALWANGWLDWTTSPDNTNFNYLINSRYSSLAAYCAQDKRIFKCPADVYVSLAQRARGWTSRVRSYSGNVYVGLGNAWTNVAGGPSGPNNLSIYKGAAKNSDLLIPGPSQTWMYMDEHPDSINDSASFPPDSATNMPDVPATYHERGAGFVMTDGHSELHRWKGPALNKPTSTGGWLGVNFSSRSLFTVRGDPDLYWFSYISPRKTSRTVAD